MIENGRIVAHRPNREAVIEVERSGACDRCHARGACAMTLGERRLEMTVGNPLGATVGQRVTVELDDRAFLAACALVYLIPLAALLAAAVAAHLALAAGPLAAWRDPGSAVAALLGLAAGLGVVRLIEKRIRDPRRPYLERYRAQVTGIIEE